MILFGYGVTAFGNLADSAWLHGLKIVAVAVGAQAVWGMARNLCPDRERATIAVGAAMAMLASPSASSRIGAIAAGGLVGCGVFRGGPAATGDIARLASAAPLVGRRHRAVGVAALASRDPWRSRGTVVVGIPLDNA